MKEKKFLVKCRINSIWSDKTFSDEPAALGYAEDLYFKGYYVEMFSHRRDGYCLVKTWGI